MGGMSTERSEVVTLSFSTNNDKYISVAMDTSTPENSPFSSTWDGDGMEWRQELVPIPFH